MNTGVNVLFHAQLGLLLAILACSQPPSEPHALPEDTVALGPELTLETEPMGVIGGGGTEERPGHALHLVRGGVLLSSGRVVLANEGSQSLRYFSGNGRYLQEMGGQGGGPGEFQRLRSVHHLPADSVATWDPGHRRITVFDSAGSIVETIPVRVGDETPGRFYPRTLHGIGSGGFVVIHQQARAQPAMRPWRDAHYLTFLSRSGSPRATVGPVAGSEFFGGLPAPFGSRFLAAGGEDRFYVGYGRGAYVTEYDPEGTPIRRLRLPIQRQAMSHSHLADLREQFLGNASPRNRSSLAELYDGATAAVDSFLAYTALVPASDGSLWVRLGAPEAVRELLAIDPVERVARPITLLEDMELLDADLAAGRVLLQVTDAADREIVQVHRVR